MIIRSYLARLPAITLALLCPFLALQPAWGQTSANPPAAKPVETGDGAHVKSEAGQTVEVKGAYNQRRQDTASKTVITHEEIIRFGDTNLTDVLKRLPGVTIGGGIRLRGLGNGYTQVLLNGEPAPPGFQIDTLTPDSIEKIEIIRAASAEYSTQAIAGTINIITKKTVQTAQREVKWSVGDESGRVNSWLNLQSSDKKGPFSYTLSGSLFHYEFGQEDGYGATRAQDANGNTTFLSRNTQDSGGHSEGFNINPRLNWKLANGDTLVSQSFLRYFDSRSHSGSRTDTLIGTPLPYPDSRTRTHSDGVSANTNLNWLHKLDNGGKLDFKVSLNYSHRDSDSRLLGGDLDGQGQLDRDSINRSTDYGLTASGKYSLTTAKEHTLVVGWDGGANQRDEHRIQQDALPAGGDRNTFVPINLDERFHVKVNRLALFGQDEWSLTPRWSLYLGLRWEGVQTESSGDQVPDSVNRSSVFSPIVQTLWKLPNTKDSQVRLALARTYKAPNLGDLNARRVFAAVNTATSPDTQGNPDLRPELAWGLDLAFEHFLEDGGVLSASSYVRRISNVNGRDVFFEDGRYVNRPVNDGTALSRGIELEAKFPLRAFIPDAPAAEFRFNLACNWSRVSNIPGPDNRIDGQTPYSANFGVDYKFSTVPLTLGGNLSLQGNGTVRTSATQTQFETVTRRLDVFALWKLDKKDQIRLSLNNLLHQDDQVDSHYADENGRRDQSSVNPSVLGVRLTLEHKF